MVCGTASVVGFGLVLPNSTEPVSGVVEVTVVLELGPKLVASDEGEVVATEMFRGTLVETLWVVVSWVNPPGKISSSDSGGTKGG